MRFFVHFASRVLFQPVGEHNLRRHFAQIIKSTNSKTTKGLILMPRKTTVDDIQLRKVIAKRLWSSMTDQGLTQVDLAEQSGVSKNTVNNILYEKQTASIAVMVAISKALYVSIDYLCGVSEDR